jgi:hypothetical protein
MFEFEGFVIFLSGYIKKICAHYSYSQKTIQINLDREQSSIMIVVSYSYYFVNAFLFSSSTEAFLSILLIG